MQEPAEESFPDLTYFLKFKEEHIDGIIEPYRTEWKVAAPDLSLGGTIDFIGKSPDGSFVMIDWKVSV